MRPRIHLLAVALAALLAPHARALGPHEILLFVNSASPRSVEVGNEYAAARQVPPENIVRVNLPDSVLLPSGSITPDQFREWILAAGHRVMIDRQVGDHILAWVYAPDFPLLVTSDPQVSLHGLTFTRGRLPDAEMIRAGRFGSPLFSGPVQGSDRKGVSLSMEQYAARLLTNMPMPSMSIAHTGARGMSVSDAVARVRSLAKMDGSPVGGDIVFLKNSDVRSTCRDWQYDDVVAELRPLGIRAIASDAMPKVARLAGFLTGAAWVDPSTMPALSPGSIAEHLTSFGALFERHDQSMVTEWLRAGAAGTAGTVTEPYAIWTKFPHARVFTHYANGCTLLEAMSQSLASPMQTALLGDPLLAPWARPPGLTLISLQDDPDAPVSGTATFVASAWGGALEGPPVLMFFVNGRTLLTQPGQSQIEIDTTALTDGYHELRAVAYSQGAVRHQNVARLGFRVDNRGRSLRVTSPAAGSTVDLTRATAIAFETAGAPKEIGLWRSGEVLARQPAEGLAAYALQPALLGAGPHDLSLAAVYDDGSITRSAPVEIVVRDANRPALVDGIERASRDDGSSSWTARVRDDDGDPVSVRWGRDIVAATAGTFDASGGSSIRSGGGIEIRPSGDLAVVVLEGAPSGILSDFSATLRMPETKPDRREIRAGLVFNYRDPSNFTYFGWEGENSSWFLGTFEGGAWRREWALGAYAAPGQDVRLDLRSVDGGVEARVDGLRVALSKRLPLGGPFGFAAGGPAPLLVRRAVAAPAWNAGAVFIVAGGSLVVPPGTQAPADLVVLADDGIRAQAYPATGGAGDQ